MKNVLCKILFLMAIFLTACSDENVDMQPKKTSTQQENQEAVAPAEKVKKEEVVQEDKEAQEVVVNENSCAYLKFNEKELQTVFIYQELNRIENGRYLNESIEYQANRMNPEIVCKMVEKINSLSDTFVKSQGGTGEKDNGYHENRTIVIQSMNPDDLYHVYHLKVSIKKYPDRIRHFVYSVGGSDDTKDIAYDFDEAKLDELLEFLSTIEPTFSGIK